MKDSFVADFRAELRRIGLDPDEMQAFAVGGDPAALLAHVRTLPRGSSWADVFPGMSAGWSPSKAAPERALGPFDYPEPPRGIAVFACLKPGAPVDALDAAIARARTLGYPIHGAGKILDRGHPHLYIVLPRGASKDDADEIAMAIGHKNGISNAYPIVRE
jgi:hypothetical protein